MTSAKNRAHNFKHSVFGLWIAVMSLSACKKDDAPSSPIDIFYKSMTSLQFEVAYEVGAEPYTINTSGNNAWEYAEMNIESLFIKRPVALDVLIPNGINEMKAIPDQNKQGFTVDNILGLANVYRRNTGNETDGNIFILFLKGYFQQNNELRQDVMGVHVTGTTVVAIFKPLISSLFLAPHVKEYIEQSVVIHEIGHALGLVKIGLPMTTPHHDDDHEGHCTNTDCVMFWKNEGADIAAFLQNYSRGRRLIFGQECVADVTAYKP